RPVVPAEAHPRPPGPALDHLEGDLARPADRHAQPLAALGRDPDERSRAAEHDPARRVVAVGDRFEVGAPLGSSRALVRSNALVRGSLQRCVVYNAAAPGGTSPSVGERLTERVPLVWRL